MVGPSMSEQRLSQCRVDLVSLPPLLVCTVTLKPHGKRVELSITGVENLSPSSHSDSKRR
jgi:hypothetical protein